MIAGLQICDLEISRPLWIGIGFPMQYTWRGNIQSTKESHSKDNAVFSLMLGPQQYMFTRLHFVRRESRKRREVADSAGTTRSFRFQEELLVFVFLRFFKS
jgi:hypothetical protein